MAIILIPTFYVVFKVINEDTCALTRVFESKTKGAAVKWIYKSGEQGVNYCIKEFLKKG